MNPNTATLNHQLNALCVAGKPMEAFEQFYDETVQMQENNDPPRVGKALNRQACQGFVDQAPDLVMSVTATAVDGHVAFTEWRFQYTGPDGQPIDYHEVSVRHWKDGKVVAERFFYGA